MPFNWTLNPYRGCTHACHYCFARRYQTQFELGPGDEFSSVIFVKTNLVEVLRRELDHPSWTREQVGVRHRHRSLSADRRALQAHAPRARSAARGPHADRPGHERADGRPRPRCPGRHEPRLGCTVYMSVPTVDERRVVRARARHRASAAAAPRGAAAARRGGQRRRADGAARPGLHAPQPAQLEATIKAIADHGAAFVGANVMYLKEGTKDHFLGFIAQRVSRRCWTDSKSCTRAPYAPSGYVAVGPRDGRRASGALRRQAARTPRTTGARGERPEPGNDERRLEQAAFEW